MRKRGFIYLLCLTLALSLAPALAQESAPVLGVCIYNCEDTFMHSLLEVLSLSAQDKATTLIRDAQNDQNLQNDQVEELIKSGVDALIINPVDRTSAIYHLRMAMKYQIPIIFINREPLREDLALYDKAYYVGIDPKQQGLLAGQQAADCFLSHPEADKNGDGKMQLVMFRGEPGHQDTELRSLYALRALQEAGITVDTLSDKFALWERTNAQTQMSVLLNTYSERIECVIANNDDMALGAIDALKAAGYFSGDKYIPVIGTDATLPAREALEQGSLYATVANDAEGQADAALLLALLLAQNTEITTETFPYPMQNKVVYIDSQGLRP